MACLQDLSQARARAGAAADGFFSLFGAKVLLPGIGDLRTLEGARTACLSTRSTGWPRAPPWS
ncbi:MAG: hypothetical protein ABSE77_19970 [Acidimicrobiales bacterium]|jgi:hypothetical protein